MPLIDSSTNTILYLSYGTGPHEQEVAFSVSSLLYHADFDSNLRILLYTDHPHNFEHLPAEVILIPSEQWQDWSGPHNFNHRRKILAVQHAFAAGHQKIVLVDGDTWFRKPPCQLFEKVAPGQSVMHIQEGRINGVSTPLFRQMTQLLSDFSYVDQNGSSKTISPSTLMWNAGVVGMHCADRHLLDDVLSLTDQLCCQSDLHVCEQFAFSEILQSKTDLTEAADLVFHYWSPWLHKPFRAKLNKIFQQAIALPEDQRGAFLYKHRPRPNWRQKAKVVCKRCCQMLGLIQGRCRSNEW